MHDIVHELTIDASLDEVYAAVATGPGLARWWSSDVSLESDAGTGDAAADDQEVVARRGEARQIA